MSLTCWQILIFDQSGKIIPYEHLPIPLMKGFVPVVQYINEFWDSEIPNEAVTFTISGGGAVRTYDACFVRAVRAMGEGEEVWAEQPLKTGIEE